MTVDVLTVFLRNVGTSSEGEPVTVPVPGGGHMLMAGDTAPTLGKKVLFCLMLKKVKV